MHDFITLILSYFGSLSYWDIFFLMTLESSIVPVPSELVMIPAGWHAASGGLNPYFAVLVGVIGSVFGALLNYWILGRWIGKPFLEKYGKYILITKEKYERTEALFLKNQSLYTFVGRLIPVVRHLISIPAGIFLMRMPPFLSMTFLGATLWCGILVSLGYFFGQTVVDLVVEYMDIIKYVTIPLIAFFIWWKIFRKRK